MAYKPGNQEWVYVFDTPGVRWRYSSGSVLQDWRVWRNFVNHIDTLKV